MYVLMIDGTIVDGPMSFRMAERELWNWLIPCGCGNSGCTYPAACIVGI